MGTELQRNGSSRNPDNLSSCIAEASFTSRHLQLPSAQPVPSRLQQGDLVLVRGTRQQFLTTSFMT